MTLTIGDDVLRSARLSAEELRLELAIALFREERLTLAQAAGVAEIDRLSFQRALAARKIPIPYDLDGDLETLDQMRESEKP